MLGGTLRPERPGGLEVDDQREFRRLLNRQVGGIGASEDAVYITGGLCMPLDQVERVGQQAASSRKVRRANQRQTVTQCGGDDHAAMQVLKLFGRAIRLPPGSLAKAARVCSIPASS